MKIVFALLVCMSTLVRAESLPLTVPMATSATQGWMKKKISDMQDGKNIAGQPMRMAGIAYGQGIGTHALSKISFSLSGELAGYDRFTALAGIDDSQKANSAKVVFSVLLDGKEVFKSGEVTPQSGPVAIDVPLNGAGTLTLTADPAGDMRYDYADWADAMLVRGGKPATVAEVKGTPGFKAADIFQVDAGGEWKARRELMMRNLLVWYPTFFGIKQDGRTGPLDFDKEILPLWTVRMEPAKVRDNPNTYTGLGKTLLAMIRYAKDSGDAHWIAEKNRIIGTILQSQEADGYLGNIQRPDPEKDPAVALWQYWNLHDSVYLCLALTENYRLFGHEPSLAAARRYMDFVMAHWGEAPKRPGQVSPIGITDFGFALYENTGEKKYLDFIAGTPFDGRFIEKESLRDWRQELYPVRSKAAAEAGGNVDAGATAVAQKVHSYRYFARLIDQLKLYGAQADKDSGLLAMSRYTLDKLADADAPGLFISGANSRSEGWVEDQRGEGSVGEGCAVVHMVWWLSKLIEVNGDLSYGDRIERAILNHLEAAQDPRTGQTRYDVCLSGERNFRKGAHCCDGNHKRFWADIEGLIYYGFDGGLAVSLYTPSTARLKAGGTSVILSQQTAYPADGKVKLAVDPEQPVSFALRLRIPRWAESYSVAVNGRSADAQTVPGGLEIAREWRHGDSVTLDLPMKFRWIAGMKFYEGRAALMRGPQVFCLAPSRNPGLSGVKDWWEIAADPATVALLPPPNPDGVRLPVEAKAKARVPGQPDMDLVFSDFPISDGFETYFRLTDPKAAVRDELYGAPGQNSLHR